MVRDDGRKSYHGYGRCIEISDLILEFFQICIDMCINVHIYIYIFTGTQGFHGCCLDKDVGEKIGNGFDRRKNDHSLLSAALKWKGCEDLDDGSFRKVDTDRRDGFCETDTHGLLGSP